MLMMISRMMLIVFLLLGAAVCGQQQEDDSSEDDRANRDRNRRRSSRILPKGNPEDVLDRNGRLQLRRSILDLSDLNLDNEDETVELQLMSDEPPISFSRVKKDDEIDDPWVSWFSMDEYTGESATIVQGTTNEGLKVITGTVIGQNGTVYQIRQIADDDFIAEEKQSHSFEPENESLLHSNQTDLPSADIPKDSIDQVDEPTNANRQEQNIRRRLQDNGSVLDILVLYTKGAMCSAAGYAQGGGCSPTPKNKASIEGIIDLAIAETNKAYQLSNIPTKLRLVKVHYEPNYGDYTNTWETTLGYLRGNGDGHFDYVHSMRNQYGADFVAMFVDTDAYCGIGYRPRNPSPGDAFSLTKWRCATGYFSFAHEVAHNMGCNHDRGNAGYGTGSNHGYQYQGGSSFNDRFRSIMSYDCRDGCPRVQRFSDPEIQYNGRPIGSSTANNAKWIRQRLYLYASFRRSTVAAGSNTGANQQQTPPPQLPATPTAAPTPAPTSLNADIMTSFGGGFIGGAGNMFDLKTNIDLSVTNFAVHSYAATTVWVEIWKKNTFGSCLGHQSDAKQWTQIGRVSFQSKSANQPSILPQNSFPPIFIPAGQIQSFYVTFAGNTNYNRYSGARGDATLTTVAASNPDIEIREGIAKGYSFGDDYLPRVWNGIVYYYRGRATAAPVPVTPAPTPAPTPIPTPFPTLGQTFAFFTAAPATPEPTMLPTTAAPTKLPTDSQQIPEQLQTSFRGGNGQAGNMFALEALQDVTIIAFDIHTFSTIMTRVLIYTRVGHYHGHERDRTQWTKICDTTVQGAGTNHPTHVPQEAVTPVDIIKGQVQSFYVTLTESKIRYTNGIITADDGKVVFLNSSGNKYPFGEFYSNRIWNGILHYRTGPSSSPAPTAPPGNGLGPSKQIRTTFANKNGSFGSMFDVEAKTDLIVHNLQVHTYHKFGALVNIEVYKLREANKSFLGSEVDPSKWIQIASVTVEGRGTGNPTPLPPGSMQDVSIPRGTKQAFYVTIVGGGIRYSNGKSTAQLLEFVSNNDIVVYEGAGLGVARFGNAFTPRVFNGIVEYYAPNNNNNSNDAEQSR